MTKKQKDIMIVDGVEFDMSDTGGGDAAAYFDQITATKLTERQSEILSEILNGVRSGRITLGGVLEGVSEDQLKEYIKSEILGHWDEVVYVLPSCLLGDKAAAKNPRYETAEDYPSVGIMAKFLSDQAVVVSTHNHQNSLNYVERAKRLGPTVPSGRAIVSPEWFKDPTHNTFCCAASQSSNFSAVITGVESGAVSASINFVGLKLPYQVSVQMLRDNEPTIRLKIAQGVEIVSSVEGVTFTGDRDRVLQVLRDTVQLLEATVDDFDNEQE